MEKKTLISENLINSFLLIRNLISNNKYSSLKKGISGLHIYLLIGLILFSGCAGNGKKSDGYGNFEATETTISSESAGKLLEFKINEGDVIEAGAIIGYIDTVQLSIQRDQLNAQKQAISSKITNVLAQISVLNEQKHVANVERDRIEKLFANKAATQKQRDDVNGQISIIEKQVQQIETQNNGILSEIKSLKAQISLINDKIKKSVIINPVSGTVLTKLTEQFEICSPGKPLYKIADLSVITLRVYVSGDIVANFKIGQKVQVLVDKNKQENRTLNGDIYWVSSKSEFTPKLIQTKDERVNMVYAVKIRIKNDGTLKIGMPGEVKL